MDLGQFGVGVAVLIIVVFMSLIDGVNTPETPTPTDNVDRSIGTGVTEPNVDNVPPEDSNPGTEQKPVVADDDGTDDSGDGGTTNESGSESGTFETIETGDDDTDSPTRTIRPRGSPVDVLDYNGSGGDDGSFDDSSSDDSTDDPPTDDSTDGVSSGGSIDDVGDDIGDDLDDGSNGGDLGDNIGMCTV